MRGLLRASSLTCIGLVVSNGAYALCDTFVGPASQTFSTPTQVIDGKDYFCAKASVLDGSDIVVDAVGSFALFLFQAPNQGPQISASGSTWAFHDLAGGDYSIGFADTSPGFSWTLGVQGSTAPVPEPSTSALLLAGLAGVSFALRRRMT